MSLSKLMTARSFKELLSAFDGVIQANEANDKAEATKNIKGRVDASKFGVQKQYRVDINKTRATANNKAIEILGKAKENPDSLTNEDYEALAAYTGDGGIGGDGVVFEYYTPHEIASGAWDALKAMGFGGGSVLDPSGATGIFSATKPDATVMTVSEISETSSAINQLLHPNDLVMNKPFEQLSVETPDNSFDAVITNVPFSDTRGKLGNIDPKYKHVSNLGAYFVYRALDKCKEGGLVALICPTAIVSGSKIKEHRKEWSLKAEFLGAHRMPSGVFANNGSKDVVTDLLIFRKHTAEQAEKIAQLSGKQKTEFNVLWDQFINGKWFEKDGKRFVYGEVEYSDYRNSITVKADNVDFGQIAKNLSRKFDSRIDWEALGATEATAASYVEGDTLVIAGSLHQLIDGQWINVETHSLDMNKLDKAAFGFESAEQAMSLFSAPETILELNFDQFTNVVRALPAFQNNDQFKLALKLASEAPVADRTFVVQAAIIGKQLSELTALTDQGVENEDTANKRNNVKAAIKQLYKKHGKAPASIKKLTGAQAGFVNSVVASYDVKNDKFSSLVEGTQARYDTKSWDMTDKAQAIRYLFTQKDLKPVDLDDLNEVYEGEGAPLSLDDFYQSKDVAVTPDGHLEPMDRFAAGNINQKIQSMRLAMTASSDEKFNLKMLAQIELIESKREKTPLNTISFSMKSRWIDRKYILEFMDSIGYDEFDFGELVEGDGGQPTMKSDLNAKRGRFFGYNKYGSKNKNYSFQRQLENYLNGDRFTGSREQREKIQGLEERFNNFMRLHEDGDLIEAEYNETFNNFIPFDYDDSPLQLKGVSAAVKTMAYQNSAVRRNSESGGNIIAFGTGLGKTFTGLASVAYNTQLGRSKRTCIVVPKNVLENWYHESRFFFGDYHGKRVKVIGIETSKNKEGVIDREPWLDKDGNQRVNKYTNEKEWRDIIKSVSAAKIVEQMNSIPHSDYDVVIMTKENFGKLPLRPESKEDFIDKMVANELIGERQAANEAGITMSAKETYKQAKARARKESKFSEKGRDAKNSFPYLEDMGFDKVIADEGHVYRNSFKAGRDAQRTAYCPVSPPSQTAIDMAIKGDYIKQKNGGRGVTFLTATPTVNSPIDCYNMLSHIIPLEEWEMLGIRSVDDFLREFGKIENKEISTLSGAIVTREALVGFKNLKALRTLFKKHVDMRSMFDVSADVKMPRQEDEDVHADLTKEQADIYEELRSQADSDERRKQEQTGEPVRELFSIIRDMDRVSTDVDLYNKRMTFLFKLKDKSKVEDLIADLPDSVSIPYKPTESLTDESDLPDYDEAKNGLIVGKKRVFEANEVTTTEGKTFVLSLHETFENEVMSRLAKFGIDERSINHKTPPKYAKMLENLKTHYEAGGKQIIFTEEKTQHNKIKRMIMAALDIDGGEIGIINADTTSGKVSIDDIGEAYNTGIYKIVICNKKAEVGVNLQHGTTAMHHLTLPWTPASVQQRNGRGIRVGGEQDSVKVFYYLGKGSFDAIRKDSLLRKANWMADLFNGDEDEVENGDALNADEINILLAKDPEEARKRMEAQRIKIAEEKEAKARNAALINLAQLRQMENLISIPENKADYKAQLLAEADEYRKTIASLESTSRYSTDAKRLNQAKRALNRKLTEATDERIDNLYARKAKAQKNIKVIKTNLEMAIEKGQLDLEKSQLNNVSENVFIPSSGGLSLVVGQYYEYTPNSYPYNTKRLVKAIKIDQQAETFTLVDVTTGREATSGLVDFTPRTFKKAAGDVQNMDEWMLKLLYGEKDGAMTVLTDNVNSLTVEHLKTLYDAKRLDGLTLFAHTGESISDARIFNDTPALKDLILPEPNNNAVCAQIMTHINGLQVYEQDALERSGLLKLYLGDNYWNRIEASGTVATEKQMMGFLEQAKASVYVESDDNYSYLMTSAESEWRINTYAGRAIMTVKRLATDAFKESEYTNIRTFTEFANKVTHEYENALGEKAKAALELRNREKEAARLKAEEEARQQAAIEEARKREKLDALANEPAEKRLERTSKITDLMVKAINSGDDLAASTLLRDIYDNDERDPDEKRLMLHSDLRLAFGDDIANSEKSQHLAAPFKETDDYSHAAIRELLNNLRQYLITEKGELVGITVKGYFFEKDGITIKSNNQPVSGGRGRNKYSFGAHEALFINDEYGKNGVLFRNKDQLKRSYSAKFDTDINSDFMGAWWNIPASDANFEALKEILGLN